MQQHMTEDPSKDPMLHGMGKGNKRESHDLSSFSTTMLKVEIYDAMLPCSQTRNRVCQLFQSNPLTIIGKVITNI